MDRAPLIPASEVREYVIATSAVFWTTKGPFGALSNMAPGYPVMVNGVAIPSIEALYQSHRFPDYPEFQAEVIQEGNAWLAKRKAKHLDAHTRPDWFRVRVRIMRWCLRLKLGHHPQRFGEVLLATGDDPIVERSSRDAFWGARSQGGGTLQGVNALGRLLMELREELISDGASKFHVLETPDIPGFKFLGEDIGDIECVPGMNPRSEEVPWVIDPSQDA